MALADSETLDYYHHEKWRKELDNILTQRHPKKASINTCLFLYSFQCTAMLHSIANLVVIIGERGLMLLSGIIVGSLPQRDLFIL
jgi:hypothetical protein